MLYPLSHRRISVSLNIIAKNLKFVKGKSEIFFFAAYAAGYQVFLINRSLHRGQVMAILPLPRGTRTA